MPTFKPALLAATIAAALAGGAIRTPALADSAADGKSVAVRWCAACHDVGSGERRTSNDLAPTFESVARRGDLSQSQLEAWIGNPHPPMPNLNLSRQDVSNLVDYIQSLATQR
jgi:mono/diheme cytochrome c family protein